MKRIGRAVNRAHVRPRGAVAAPIVALFLFLGLLIGAGWLLMRVAGDDTVDAPLTATAKLAPFDHVVTEHGEVESSENVEVMCEVKSRNSAGTAIIDVVPEGTEVAKGDWLVTLDSSALEDELQAQKIAVNTSRAKVIVSKALLEQAQIGKIEYLQGTFKQEEQLIESEILIAEEKLSRAEENAKFSQRLAALGFQTALQLKADLFAVEQAKVELDLAQSRLQTLREISKNKMVVGFESDIEANGAQVEADQSSYDEELHKLKEIEDQVAKCRITAPQAGQVVYANITSHRGNAEFVVEPGASVRERQAIIRLPDQQKMQVKATINESGITLVETGMPVDIHIGAFEEGRVLKGRVKKVNKYAEPSSWFSSQVKEYATFIDIAEPPPDLRTGMTAEVRIYVNRMSEALQLPVQTIYEHKGHTFCIVQAGAAWETREIIVGATNDKTVTILSGVSEGEQVVLNPRQHMDKLNLPKGLREEQPDKKAPTESPGGVAERTAIERAGDITRDRAASQGAAST